MRNQDLLYELVHQYVGNLSNPSNDITVDLMILYQLMNLKRNTRVKEQNLDPNSEIDSEQFDDFQKALDAMIKNNRQHFNEILDFLKNNTN